jgi:hypothetical protein
MMQVLPTLEMLADTVNCAAISRPTSIWQLWS